MAIPGTAFGMYASRSRKRDRREGCRHASSATGIAARAANAAADPEATVESSAALQASRNDASSIAHQTRTPSGSARKSATHVAQKAEAAQRLRPSCTVRARRPAPGEDRYV